LRTGVSWEARTGHELDFVSSEQEAQRLYERYQIPRFRPSLLGSAFANIHPGPDDTHVNYENPNRAPLLFISGSEDHLMPPSIQRSNAKH
jgi:hypothetical protein